MRIGTRPLRPRVGRRRFDGYTNAGTIGRPLYPGVMAATPTPEGTPQRLAAIRAQMSLLADYL
jgi:hypothetical protein